MERILYSNLVTIFMKDLSGKKNPFYGKKHSAESIQKMKDAKLGKRNARFGIHLSEEIKKKIGDAQRGEKNHRWGKHNSDEWKKIMHNRMSGKNNPMYGKGKMLSGNKAYQWKGDSVSYEGLHIWAKKNIKKPDICEMCNYFKPKQLSNISGEYKRDVNDYQWLCVRCHIIYDNQIREVIGTAARDRRNKYRE
jgi:hypothetical protein